MRRIISLFIPIALAVLLPGATQAQSTERFNSIFSDYKAHDVGDILTIHIMEFASGTNRMSTNSKSENKMGVGMSGSGSLDLLPNFGISSNHGNEYKGNGAISQNGQLRAKMSAMIVEVSKTGTLKIEGMREVEINGDKQTTILTGWVRPEDISSDNVVYSHQIAAAEIRYKGRGDASSAPKPGLITRIIQFIF